MFHFLLIVLSLLTGRAASHQPLAQEAGTAPEIEKYALLVAISDYDKAGTGWNPIHAHNDIPLMKAALLYQGFPENQITVVQDPDKQTLWKAMEDFAASIPGGRGASVVVHFSAHGQQIADQDGDEVDGLDEAIIPINAAVSMNYGGSGYAGEHHLRDDEIGRFLDVVRQRAGTGGGVFLIMDACHSGTSSRGMGSPRGTDVVFGNPSVGLSHSEESGAFGFQVAAPESAPLVAFYGTGADHLNYETTDDQGNPAGSLTYAVSKALAGSNAATTYTTLFGKVRNYMARKSVRNIPQMEGPGHQEILGGALREKTTHFTTMSVETSRGYATINGGELHGIFKGARIGFFPENTTDPTNTRPIAEGEVRYTDGISARVHLESLPDDIDLYQAPAFVTQAAISYPDSISVNLAIRDEGLREALRDMFKDQSVLHFTDSPFANLVVEQTAENAGPTQIYTNDDKVIFDRPVAGTTAFDLQEALLDYVHSRHIRNLEVEDPSLGASLELIPVEVDLNDYVVTRRLPLAAKQDASGNLIFREGDVYRIRITNHSAQPVYFTVMNITPSGRKQCLIPDIPDDPAWLPMVSEAECQLPPGASVELPNEANGLGYQINNDPGKETLKLIVTTQPWFICETLESRGAGSRSAGEMNPLDILIDKTFQLDGTRSFPVRAPRGGAAISSLSYVIE